MTFTLESPAFHEGESIPFFHARDVYNRSPPLQWTGAPEKTASFILVCEDLDADDGKAVHWIVYDIPGGRTSLKEDFGRSATDERARQAVNDFGAAGYDGPLPPLGGGRHRYRFTLAALKTAALAVAPGISAAEVLRAAQPHILGKAELIGAYERP